MPPAVPARDWLGNGNRLQTSSDLERYEASVGVEGVAASAEQGLENLANRRCPVWLG